jgi:phosphate transport system substrate-binding protein
VTLSGRRAVAVVVWLVAALLAAGCGRSAAPDTGAVSIRVAADTATAPLAESLLNAYEVHQPHVVLSLARGNRDTVLGALSSGEADAAVLLYPPDTQEVFHTPIGYEQLVIVVHPEVGVDDVTRGDLRAIFSGRVTNWAALGGPDAAIQVIARERGSSTRLAFESMVMEQETLMPSARLAFDEDHMLALVGATYGSIGYVAHGSLDDRVKVLGFEGILPAQQSDRRGAYSLVTPVVFVALEKPHGELYALLEWLLSADGQAVVKRHVLGLKE